ncbi:MAG: glycosyltransferase [Candidatus Delongbacteria bacterium]|nr:glycosyltransferase [Candidatus Delongbacteria bacterium]
MSKTIIISENEIIGGAEIVLKDYLERTNNSTQILAVVRNDCSVRNFYTSTSLKRVYYTNILRSYRKITNLLLKPIQSLILATYLFPIIEKETIKTFLGNNTQDMLYFPFLKIFYPKKKFLIYVHDMVAPSISNKVIYFLFSRFFVSKFVVVSTAVQKRLIQLTIKKEKIELIFNGLPLPKVEPKKKFKPLVFIFVGRMEDRKNPHEYLDFLNILSQNNTPYEASLIYNKMDQSLLEEIRNRIKKENLSIALGNDISRQMIFTKMRAASFLFISSKRDPLPTVVLESLSLGTPVIGKQIDGIPDMVEDSFNGYIYDSEEYLPTIMRKIEKLSEEEYYNMSRNSIYTISTKFNIDHKVEKLDKLLFWDETDN